MLNFELELDVVIMCMHMEFDRDSWRKMWSLDCFDDEHIYYTNIQKYFLARRKTHGVKT